MSECDSNYFGLWIEVDYTNLFDRKKNTCRDTRDATNQKDEIYFWFALFSNGPEGSYD